MGFYQLVTSLIKGKNPDTEVTGTDNGDKRCLDVRPINTVDTPSYTRASVYDPVSGNIQSVDDNGHADIVQHAHPEGGSLHFVSGDLSADQDFILVDLSDTTNYPHINTGSLHAGWLLFGVDAPANAKFTLSFGFVDNVDGTDGDYHEIHAVVVNKATDISPFNMFPIAPNGIWAKDGKYVTSVNSLNDTAFNTGTNLATTLDPTTADTPPGTGDLVIRYGYISGGAVVLSFDLNYHSHE